MLSQFISLAFTVGVSSTYGFGEPFCGDYDQKPQPCEYGAITASGEVFDPELPTAAVAAPRGLRMYPVVVYMSAGGPCVPIRINDKLNERYIGERGFDLSRGALRALGLKDEPQLVTVTSCQPKETE